MTDYAAGMKRAAEIAAECERQNGPLSRKGFSEDYRRGLEAGAQAIKAAILAAIPPAEAPDDEADLESPDFIRGWNAAMEAQGFEAIDPPPPWQPPPEAERGQTEYERKVAQAKEDFPNGF